MADPNEADPNPVAPDTSGPIQVLLNFFKARNLTSVEKDIGSMLDAGVDPWDPQIFLRLRKKEPKFEPIRGQDLGSEPIKRLDSEPRPALEVVHLWLKIVAAKFPECVGESVCAVSPNFIG